MKGLLDAVQTLALCIVAGAALFGHSEIASQLNGVRMAMDRRLVHAVAQVRQR